jgi:DNA-binding winged helix-turn-helix (wHTH) protein/Tfp pilus assembly protein PilF
MTIHDTAGVPTPARILAFGEARWDRISRQLTVRGELVKLTWRTTEALSLLVEAKGAVVPKEDLQRLVWGKVQMDDSVLPQCIGTIRRAIDPAPSGASYIETVSRVGYRLAVEVIEEVPAPPPEAVPPFLGRRGVWRAAVAALVFVIAGLAGITLVVRHQRQTQADALVARGLESLRRGNEIDGRQSAHIFREALALIPGYAPATAGLAETAARRGDFPNQPAIELARAAVAQDPTCGECQAILGFVLGMRHWQWKEAGECFARAIELDPTSTERRHYYTEWLVVNGRMAEAAVQAESAIRIDSGKARAYSYLAEVRYFQGRYREAIQEAQKASALDGRHMTGEYWAYRSYLQLGEDPKAIGSRGKQLNVLYETDSSLGSAYSERHLKLLGASGRAGVARSWLDDVGSGLALDVHRYHRAVWSMWIGDNEAALRELEAGVQARGFYMIYVAADPAFAPLRPNPRFQEVVRKLGLSL